MNSNEANNVVAESISASTHTFRYLKKVRTGWNWKYTDIYLYARPHGEIPKNFRADIETLAVEWRKKVCNGDGIRTEELCEKLVGAVASNVITFDEAFEAFVNFNAVKNRIYSKKFEGYYTFEKYVDLLH